MKAFFETHKTLVLIIAVLLGTAILAGAAVGVLMALEPWAAEEDTPTSAPVSSEEEVSSEVSSLLPQDDISSLMLNTSSLPEGVYFYENFYNNLKASDGWAKDAGVSGGKYKGGGVVLTDFSPVTSRSDYAVEAEITVNMFPETTNQVSVAAILGRYTTSGDNGGGFEVGLATETKTGNMYIRVYDRLGKKVVCNFDTISFEANRTYTFTAVFSGTTLAVFVDGTYAGKTTVKNRAGGVGMARTGYTAAFDEFKVRKATSAELAAIKNPPKTNTSSALPVGLPEGVLFYEDFEDTLKTVDGWASGEQVTDGMYKGKNIVLTRHSAISAMKDYAVEAEIMMDHYSNTTTKTNVAAILGRYTTKKGEDGKAVSGGFEVGIVLDTIKEGNTTTPTPYLRVYDRLGKKSLATIKNAPIYVGQMHKITAVFSGTQLGIFVDGEFVGKVTVEERAGTVGVAHNGYEVMYDEFTVRKATADELAKLK